MREKGILAFEQNNKEQAKYYFQRMREVQTLIMNPTAVRYWAELEMEAYKKGKIQNVFKMKALELKDKHYSTVEHIRFSKNERTLAIMTKDFMTTYWEVGTWNFKT